MVCLLGVSAMAAGESRYVGSIVKMDSDKITLQDGDLETVTETQMGGGGQPPKAGQKPPAMPKQSAAVTPSKSVRHLVFIAMTIGRPIRSMRKCFPAEGRRHHFLYRRQRKNQQFGERKRLCDKSGRRDTGFFG